MSGLVGQFVSIPTAFTDDARTLSEVRVAKLIRFATGKGVDGFTIAAAAGEGLLLSSAERKSYLELVLRESQGRANVIVDCTSLSTARSLDFVQHASRHGAQAAIVATPYFGPVSEKEVVNHFKTIAGFGNLWLVCIDPNQIVSAEMRAELQTSFQIEFGDGSGPDDWTTSRAASSAFSIFEGEGLPLQSLTKLAKEVGYAPLSKALWSHIGLDVGSVRAPKMELPRDILHSLAA